MKVQPTKQVAKHTPAIPQASKIQEKPSTGTSAPKKPLMFDDLHVRIMVRAYELYVERGRREGCAEQDWLDAEREIVGRTASA